MSPVPWKLYCLALDTYKLSGIKDNPREWLTTVVVSRVDRRRTEKKLWIPIMPAWSTLELY